MPESTESTKPTKSTELMTHVIMAQITVTQPRKKVASPEEMAENIQDALLDSCGYPDNLDIKVQVTSITKV